MILPDEKDSIGLAVGLVNTWDVLYDPPEVMRDVDILRVLLRWFELDSAAAAASERDLPSVRRVRDRLRQAFDAGSEDEAVRVLNALARDAQAVPQLEGEEGAWTFGYGVGRRTLAQEVAARAALREKAGTGSASARPHPVAASTSTAPGTGADDTAASSAPTVQHRRPCGEGAAKPLSRPPLL